MILNKMGGYSAMVRERFKWYKMAGGGSRNHPSGGFARPFALLASGLCTRVDLYGFSARPSGKYFNKNAKVLRTHLIKFEHWVYRYLMSVGKLCVYGD
uniref:Alpha--sialyltransferase st3gal i-r2 n=1 Tax=Tetraselmis sp. GSL018 TaxID=582737 RepID=A0A061RAB2_9CHLO|eukprot:CAMPEP_0177590742 /NCGR_PEP_ID=MMETSP0419_2-20121207/7591_1 /TAXON_ID=582737 /ORGANISM="Tetraselmis sp., Strain GSL018" /LENGTH=97 /DNA_ID=CAMNT_0019081367 /DNA_START=1 /DNA_END=294 /DNA_ORIENTATION=+